MEVLGVLLVPLAIAYLIAPIAAFFMASGNRKTIGELFLRVVDLERHLSDLTTTIASGQPVAAPPQAASPSIVPRAAEAQTSQPTIEAAPASEPSPSRTPEETAELVARATIPAEASAPAAPRESFEQRVGTRWVVWVGGIALALGGIFLVSYAVEQGYFGPGMRVFLAGLLATALVATGEWARRSEKMSGFAGLPSAHVPSILTAAGTTIAYATVYGAFALYHFIGPMAAFILLGVVAIATLTAALLHGPALAALGLIGAQVAPMIISTEEPSYWALYLYLAIVTAAAFALARVRMWRWLAITAVAFGAFWALVGFDDIAGGAMPAHEFHVAVGFILVALFIVPELMFGPPTERGHIDGLSSISLAAYALMAAFLVIVWRNEASALVVFGAMAAATVAIAWRIEAVAFAVPLTAVLAALVMAAFATDKNVVNLIAPGGAVAGTVSEPAAANATLNIAFGAGFALLFGGAGFLSQGRSGNARISICWAVASVFTPLAIVAALYYRIAGVERSIPFAGLALLLAALFAYATETLSKRTPRPGSGAAEAIYATGVVAALAFALTLALEKGWLTVCLALMVPGIAWVEQQRRLHALRWLAGVIVMLVLLRIAGEPRIVGGDVGATPIFNWLLYGYGGPALAFWVGGWLMRKRADDLPLRMVESAAVLFTVLLVTLEIRHYINNGNIYAASASLTEIALQVCTGLAMAIGLEHVRARTGSVIHNVAAVVIAVLTLCAIVFGLMMALNPMVTGRPVGPPFFNLILLGYGIPAGLAIVLALRARTTRPIAYRAVAAATAVGLSLMYLTFEIARLYQGPILNAARISDAQQYTYSAVWLAYGVLLLLAGLLLASKPARVASAAVILLTILKVFLVDMADLTGVWRALSFIGLGLVLIGIGYLYQRLLFPPQKQTPASPPAAA
jgi:uncharacterized membrane protein